MCFSPTVSFATAAIAGTIGALALARSTDRRQWPLAAMPLLFAAQQCVEGALWLTLPNAPTGPVCLALSFSYLSLAQVFWPIYAPIAVILVEQVASRRRLMLASPVIGAIIAGYMLFSLLTGPHSASIANNHIIYRSNQMLPMLLGLAYLWAVCLPMVISSSRAIQMMGLVITAGSFVAHYMYWRSFLSVWCFFAATASVIILVYVEQVRRELSAHNIFPQTEQRSIWVR